MIPIRDHQSRVVAFTARQTERTPDDDPAKEAKYVNSPETPIFTKGHLLFNLDRARSNVGEGKPFVLVEGQLDALRCWSVGLKTAIAPQGTSITESQLVLVRRYHPQVECFFDSDAAGQKAALRFLPMALKAGLEVRFLGGGSDSKIDPDLLFLERGIVAYDEVRKQAQSAMAFACRAFLRDPHNASAEERARAAQSVVELITATESNAVRASLLAEAASNLWLPPKALDAEFQAVLARQGRQAAARPPASAETASPTVVAAPASANGAAHTPEHHLLFLLLHFETLGKPLSQALPPDANWVDIGHTAGALLNRFLGEIEQDAWPGRDHLDGLLETAEERTLVATLLFEQPAIEDPVKVAQEGLRQLRARALEPRLRQIELALANPRADSDSDPISLLKERSEIHRLLRQPLILAAAI
jgi:DNA primase